MEWKKIILDQKREMLDFLNKKECENTKRNDSDREIISREILHLDSYLKLKLAKIILGPRRCGKSTLAHIMLGHKNATYSYINFDDERLNKITAHDLNDMYEAMLEIDPKAKDFLFDEIQNVEGWELFVNRLLRKKSS
ncbi:MAG: AAA family ATPase [Oligoflexia bacterium]|nr:AAA family ATPase [Oligoflexia bacterium]